eukprot:1160248-Pelagomonas_calceolata.AAC.1
MSGGTVEALRGLARKPCRGAILVGRQRVLVDLDNQWREGVPRVSVPRAGVREGVPRVGLRVGVPREGMREGVPKVRKGMSRVDVPRVRTKRCEGVPRACQGCMRVGVREGVPKVHVSRVLRVRMLRVSVGGVVNEAWTKGSTRE